MPGGATGIRGQLRPKLGKCRKRWKAGWPYEAIALRRLSDMLSAKLRKDRED